MLGYASDLWLGIATTVTAVLVAAVVGTAFLVATRTFRAYRLLIAAVTIVTAVAAAIIRTSFAWAGGICVRGGMVWAGLVTTAIVAAIVRAAVIGAMPFSGNFGIGSGVG